MTSFLNTPYDMLFKIILVGDSGVGKSTIVGRWSEGTFESSAIPTIGVDFRIKTSTFADGKVAKIQTWDTAGQERFRTIVASYYRNASAIILTYDVTDVQSLFDAEHVWCEEVKKVHGDRFADHLPVILLGTKTDLAAKRAVTEAEGEAVARRIGCDHMLLSAKTATQGEIDRLFNHAAEMARSARAIPKPLINGKDAATTGKKTVRVGDSKRIAAWKCPGCFVS
jgi:Ras-related protein Rab-1A